ncbi:MULTISPECIES: hypothetical protein [unclassified Rhizobium]|nr:MULTISPECIES: hypothetical protein [unclassified Rhizobium]MBX5291865.1 hypothetical protein [Rhizobium sp. NLR15a]MBX5257457.1 hypothetical protein [Rhizobium sp. NLR16b]MBX5263549.1 hypothetical protein [Rhizobium sp. NLR16a]MBX5312114.1 hypothetical protein [Rhizobium sp. NLR11b]QTU95543.1 hypothetical protein J7U39_13905 [Rhizobium sp. NLR16a]
MLKMVRKALIWRSLQGLGQREEQGQKYLSLKAFSRRVQIPFMLVVP